jgi:methionyl-tRNA synthetase
VIPQATAKLWTALGAEAALGALSAQPIREAGDWGRLPAGTEQQPLAVLFPRIEADSR